MLASDAISRAYREAAIKPIGTIPSVDEFNEGLDRLNGFLFSLLSEEIGEKLSDVQVPNNLRATAQSANPINIAYPDNIGNFHQPFSPGEAAEPTVYNLAPNSRVIWRGTTAATVYLPEYPSDGCRIGFADVGSTAALTINANGRKIEGAATKVVASGASPAEWFYRADLGEWIVLRNLELTDSLPLPQGFDRLLICGTAIALTGLDEINPTTGTMTTYTRLLKLCKSRYAQAGMTTGGGENVPSSVQAFGWVTPW